MYQDAAELASKLAAPALIEQFRPRFVKIIRDTGHIGWGFHDGLEEIYWGLLPEAEEAR